MPTFLNSYFIVAKNKYSKLEEEKKLTGFALQNSRRESNVMSGSVLKEMYDELDDNLDLLKKYNGTPVKFGSYVQFLHMDSQKFLGFSPNRSSQSEPDNLAVELADEFSDLTKFKLLPVFNYQANNNGMIFNGDEVYVLSCSQVTKGSYEPYLNASKAISSITSLENQQDDTALREINMTVDKNSSFRLNIFSSYIDNYDNLLKVSDVIGITYSELGLNLVSVGYKGMKKQVGRFSLRVETDKLASLLGNSNGMYRIENYDSKDSGGFLEWGKSYRLKHIGSSTYLTMDSPAIDKKMYPSSNVTRSVVFTENISAVKPLTFELIPSTLGSKNRPVLLRYIMKDSYFKLISKEDKNVFRLQVLENKGRLDPKNKAASGLDPVFSMEDKDNIFKVSRISANSVGSTNFILSSKTSIMAYLTDYLLAEKVPEQANELKKFQDETEFTLMCFKVDGINV